MIAKIERLTFFILASGIFLFSGAFQEQRETESLIRKELLVYRNKKFPSPQRNIFVRQGAINQQGETSSSTGRNLQILNANDSPSREEIREETEKKDMNLNLIYIGYVKSGNRVVALILLEGVPYSVESGDVLEAGGTVGEISSDDIEIIGPDSVSRRIKLEGE